MSVNQKSGKKGGGNDGTSKDDKKNNNSNNNNKNDNDDDNIPRRKESIPDFDKYQRQSVELEGDEYALNHDDEEIGEEDEPCQEKETREKPWKDMDLQKALAKYHGRAVPHGGGGGGARQRMEYDLQDMYPEMSLLTDNKKRDWDFQDPDVIRALWLESKTNVLAEWKFKYGKEAAKGRKSKVEIRGTLTTEARMEYRRQQEEKRKNEAQLQWHTVAPARDAPEFGAVEIASNATTNMRLKFNRNNPTVPRYYLEHFQRYRKPPFRTAIPVGGGKRMV